MPDEDIKRVTLRIPKRLHDELIEASFKSRKQGEVKSINTIGVEALEMWLKSQEPKGQGRGVNDDASAKSLGHTMDAEDLADRMRAEASKLPELIESLCQSSIGRSIRGCMNLKGQGLFMRNRTTVKVNTSTSFIP